MSQYNIKGLWHLYDLVESQVRGLRALGVPPHSYGSLLSSVLINKLPQELCLIVSHEARGREWEHDELMKIIEGEIKARESTTITKSTNRVPPTGTALMSHDTSTTISCFYCCQPHTSNSCPTVTDIVERKCILKTSGRCFVCLRKYHRAMIVILIQDIPSVMGDTMSASVLEDHHNLLWETSHQQLVYHQTIQNQHLKVNSQLTLSPTHQPQTHPPQHQCIVRATRHQCCCKLLELMSFKASNPTEVKEVGIIFDSGSQRSCITTKLRNLLSLNHHHTETMIMKTFVSSEGSKQLCEVVSIRVILKDGGTLKLPLLSVPLICEPLSCQTITYVRENLDYILGLDLAVVTSLWM